MIRWGRTRQPTVPGCDRITGLTARQVEILDLAAHGLSGRQIGRRLGISARTVEGHFSKMRRYTGARSEAELTAYAAAAGLLTLDPAPVSPDGIPGRETAYPRPPPPGAGKRPFAGTPEQAVNPQPGGVGNTRRKSMPENASTSSFRHTFFGYARISTAGQDPGHQIDALLRAGVPREQIYRDTAGTKASRPQLDLLLQVLRTGDTLKVTRLDRLARSVLHLITLGAHLRERGVALHVIDQGIDTATAEGRAMLGMLSVLAELQRELTVASTRDGLAAARARSQTGGRPPRLTPAQGALAQQLYDAGDKTVQQIADILQIPRSTLYGYLATTSAAARRPKTNPPAGDLSFPS